MVLKFRPDIEGLRALAIVPVVLFHAFPSALPGGFVGVDIFFVISGYLITSLLMQRLDQGQYSIGAFYAARIRRIFPALFFMLALVTPFALWLMAPNAVVDFGRTLGATALFLSNMELYRTTGYFDGAAELKPLVHTWSLAVEEQYYIFFPLLLAWLYRVRRAAIPLVLTLIGLASLALSVWWVKTNPSLAFYSIPSRTVELMIGSLLAVGLFRRPVPQWLAESVAALGLALLLVACFAFTPATPFPGWAALLPCIGCALLIWVGTHHTTKVGDFISTEPFRWIGKLSFSFYLWHWPALVLLRHVVLGEPEPWQTTLAVLLSLLLAYVSWRWVEAPVRRSPVRERPLLLAGLVAIVLGLGSAGGVILWAKWQQKQDKASTRVLAGAKDFSPERGRCHGLKDLVIPYASQCRFGATDSPRHDVVWGDSHGAELALALGERLGRTGGALTQITSSACPPSVGLDLPNRPNCAAHNQATLEALIADAALDRVVLVARYQLYVKHDAAAFEAGLNRAITALTAAGKRVVLVDPYPGYLYPVPEALSNLSRRGGDPATLEQSIDEYRHRNAPALAMLERLGALPGVTRVKTSDALCGDGTCAVIDGGKPLYFDDNHLSMTGARRLVAAFPE